MVTWQIENTYGDFTGVRQRQLRFDIWHFVRSLNRYELGGDQQDRPLAACQG